MILTTWSCPPLHRLVLQETRLTDVNQGVPEIIFHAGVLDMIMSLIKVLMENPIRNEAFPLFPK